MRSDLKQYDAIPRRKSFTWWAINFSATSSTFSRLWCSLRNVSPMSSLSCFTVSKIFVIVYLTTLVPLKVSVMVNRNSIPRVWYQNVYMGVNYATYNIICGISLTLTPRMKNNHWLNVPFGDSHSKHDILTLPA